MRHDGSVHLRLLGRVEVDGGGRLGGGKARGALAALALRWGQVVAVERLIDDLWSGDPPATARNTVQVYVSAARRALERSGGSLRVEGLPGGYRLLGPREQIDWHLFRETVTHARVLRQQGDPGGAARMLATALTLWGGPPLADVGDCPLRTAFAPAMEAARVAATADRFDADLRLPVRPGLVAELTEVVGAHPLDERFAGQLMLAHHRADQRTEALAVYAQLRRRLVDELGVEPGNRLRELHRAVLADDPALHAAAETTAERRPPAPHWPGGFVGAGRRAHDAGRNAARRAVRHGDRAAWRRQVPAGRGARLAAAGAGGDRPVGRAYRARADRPRGRRGAGCHRAGAVRRRRAGAWPPAGPGGGASAGQLRAPG
jgi:DNA-binding SARP family transcriptional activator